MNRLACKRAFPEKYPFPGEGRGRLVLDGIKAVMDDPFSKQASKLLIALWFILVGLAPRPLALQAIKARLCPTEPIESVGIDS
jgi:hypothetical protein